MNDVTRILSAIERGDSGAADRLLPLVYDELRKLAARRLVKEKPVTSQKLRAETAWQLVEFGHAHAAARHP